MLRKNKLFMTIDVINELLLIFAHLEEIILLFDLFDIPKLAGFVLLLGNEAFLGNRIPAFILININVTVVINLLKNLLDDCFVPILRRTDKVIITDFEFLPEFQKAWCQVITMSLRIHSPLLGGLLDFLSVFIQSGQEKNLIARFTVKSGEHIGKDRGIGMADMRPVVHVINGSRNVEPTHQAIRT